MAYNDVHRAMLQTLMSQRFIPENEVRGILANLWSRYNLDDALPTDGKGFKAFFETINKKIGLSGLKYAEIKNIKDDTLETKYWGLASIDNTPILKPDSKETGHLDMRGYSDPELHLFKKIIEVLVTDSRKKGLLDHNSCINLGLKGEKDGKNKLRGEEASRCIDRLVEEGWLREVEDAAGARGRHNAKRITLGIASLLDTKAYILKKWPDESERCCIWQHDWLFKWVGNGSEEQQEEGSECNSAGKRPAPADAEGRKRARPAESESESD